MKICKNDNCKKVIIGGFKDNGISFCNQLCHKEGYYAVISNEISPKKVVELAKKIHDGICPRCKRKKTVDIYMSYRIYSLLISYFGPITNICCSSCGKIGQISDLFISLFFGWFSPQGLVYTPAYVLGNIAELFRGGETTEPSPKLENYVKKEIATQLYNENVLHEPAREIISIKLPQENYIIEDLYSEKSLIKRAILKICFNLKFSNILLRFIFTLLIFVLIIPVMLPDLLFNLKNGNPVEISINDLKLLPKEKIPEYIKIKDAFVPDNLFLEHRKDEPDKKLDYILYPAFNSLAETNEELYLIVKDANVEEDELKTGEYFLPSKFKLEGKIAEAFPEIEGNEIMKNMGYKINKNALLINRGSPLPLISCLIIIIFFGPIGFFLALSLIPSKVLRKILIRQKS